MTHSAANDARCFYSWPDRNSIRTHVCIATGTHDEHICGACGCGETSPIPPAMTEETA